MQMFKRWILAGVLLQAVNSTAWCQVAPPKADPPNASESELAEGEDVPRDGAGLVLADRTLLSSLGRAKKLAEQSNYAEAVGALQEVLDQAGVLDGVPDDLADATVLRSLQADVEAFIGAMPAEGKQAYEMTFAAEADRLLEEALNESDAEQVRSVSRRFFHTRAGRIATMIVADHLLDQQRPFAAALLCSRLLSTGDLRREDQPLASVKCAVAWLRCGHPQTALRVLEQMKSDSPNGTIIVPGAAAPPFTETAQALNWLRENLAAGARVSPEGSGWFVVGGNESRSGSASGPPPAGAVAWSESTAAWQGSDDAVFFFTGGRIDLGRQIEAIQAEVRKNKLSPLPACIPLVVDKIAIVRGLDGLRAYDAATGQLKWRSGTEGKTIEDVMQGKISPPSGSRGSMLDPLLRQRMFTDDTFGSLSSDGSLVSSVETLGVCPAAPDFNNPRQFLIQMRRAPPELNGNSPLLGKNDNRLVARAVENGKTRWTIDGRARKRLPLSMVETESSPTVPGQPRRPAAPAALPQGNYFLGPPLPFANSLFCLVESGRLVHLAVLEPATGNLQWSLVLGRAPSDIAFDHLRGQAGLSPSFAGEMLICPTGIGKLVAVDCAARRIAWRYQYRKYEEFDPNDSNAMVRIAILGRARPQEDEKPKGEWHDSHAVLAGGRVVITPRDADDLHCLDLKSGKVLWKLPRESRLFIGGVYGESVLVVGSQQVELLRLADGKAVWKSAGELPPGGCGVVIGARYHLPLATGEIAEIDLNTGRLVSRVKLPDKHRAGNLVAAGEAVFSQSFDRFHALQPAKE